MCTDALTTQYTSIQQPYSYEILKKMKKYLKLAEQV